MNANFFRAEPRPPRPGEFIQNRGDNIDKVKLEQFIEDVWADLVRRLQSPIVVTEADGIRRVEVLGCLRYTVNLNTGIVGLECLQRADRIVQFLPAEFRFSVDLPLLANGSFLEDYFWLWRDEMGAVLIDHRQPGYGWNLTVRDVFWRAIRQATYWKRLRRAVRDALGLDAAVLAWCRHGRSIHDNKCIDNLRYNRTVCYRGAYAEVEQDNPKLLWLLTLLIEELTWKPTINVVSDMKRVLAEHGVSPAGWRLLPSHRERDFWHIRDWIGPHGRIDGRVPELQAWLGVLVALRRRTPLPRGVQRIFLHDSFDLCGTGNVLFRNVRIGIPVLRIIVDEAVRRHANGTLHRFACEDLVEVMTWLEAERPELDANQVRRGWKSLVTRAVAWKVRGEMAETLGQLTWTSALPVTHIGAWTIVPIENAWALREEALRQHHCVDRYLSACVARTKQLFSVRTSSGRTVATIGIERGDAKWQSFGIRGVCNAKVEGSLEGLDEAIAERYTDIWRLTRPEDRLEEDVEDDDRDDVCNEDLDGFADDEDGQDEDAGPTCPLCGDTEWSCNHVVASIDATFGELGGGQLFAEWDRLQDRMEKILLRCIENGDPSTGRGPELDSVLRRARRALDRGGNPEDVMSDAHSELLTAAQDILDGMVKVFCTQCDIDGGMPGQSSSYATFWAADPEAVVARLVSMFAEDHGREAHPSNQSDGGDAGPG